MDFTLNQASTELEEIVVSGQDLRSRIQREGNALAINAERIEKLPLEGRNFTGLTNLSPLQGGGSINLGGQRRTSTNVTLDGVNARNQLTAGEIGRGPYTVSIEAIREFEVATNVYDVTQGRQAGGALNAVTKSGTNTFEGSAFVYHRNDALASGVTIEGDPRQQDFYNYQWGFSLGGPIIKDKMHFFVAFDRQDAGEPVFIANIDNEADESRLGIRQDTLQRFINIARDLYGVSDEQQVGEFARKTVANTLFARIDWQLNNKHKLTLRNNFTNWDNPLSVSDNSRIEIAETYANFTSNENSLLLSLRSNLNSELTNELKVQYQRAERAFAPNAQLPFSNIPRAIVNVSSPFPTDTDPDATRTVTAQIGGQRFTPETNLEQQLQLVNTTYLQAGRFNFTLGTDNMMTYLETLLSNEQNGRFFFSSLEDFANLNPDRYAREVPLQGLPIVKQTVLDLSLFARPGRWRTGYRDGAHRALPCPRRSVARARRRSCVPGPWLRRINSGAARDRRDSAGAAREHPSLAGRSPRHPRRIERTNDRTRSRSVCAVGRLPFRCDLFMGPPRRGSAIDRHGRHRTS